MQRVKRLFLFLDLQFYHNCYLASNRNLCLKAKENVTLLKGVISIVTVQFTGRPRLDAS